MSDLNDEKRRKIDDVEGVDASYRRLAHKAPGQSDDDVEDGHEYSQRTVGGRDHWKPCLGQVVAERAGAQRCAS